MPVKSSLYVENILVDKKDGITFLTLSPIFWSIEFDIHNFLIPKKLDSRHLIKGVYIDGIMTNVIRAVEIILSNLKVRKIRDTKVKVKFKYPSHFFINYHGFDPYVNYFNHLEKCLNTSEYVNPIYNETIFFEHFFEYDFYSLF